jgi:hypothetical protein
MSSWFDFQIFWSSGIGSEHLLSLLILRCVLWQSGWCSLSIPSDRLWLPFHFLPYSRQWILEHQQVSGSAMGACAVSRRIKVFYMADRRTEVGLCSLIRLAISVAFYGFLWFPHRGPQFSLSEYVTSWMPPISQWFHGVHTSNFLSICWLSMNNCL